MKLWNKKIAIVDSVALQVIEDERQKQIQIAEAQKQKAIEEVEVRIAEAELQVKKAERDKVISDRHSGCGNSTGIC